VAFVQAAPVVYDPRRNHREKRAELAACAPGM